MFSILIEKILWTYLVSYLALKWAALLKKQWHDKTYGDQFDSLEQAWNRISASPEEYLSPEKEEVFRARWNEIYGNSLAPLALYQLLNGDS